MFILLHNCTHLTQYQRVMLKILQDRLQQYVNHELPDVQVGFRRNRELEIKLPSSTGSSKKQERSRKTYFCFIDFTKAFDCVAHNKLWKILQEMGLADHLICLLRNLNVGQETIVKTGHGTTDWLHIGKGVGQGCVLSPCLFNLCAEYILWNSRLDEAQAGIRIAGRNINNLRYADDTTLMAESEEELKSRLMKVKVETEKVGLKLNIQKTKIMASGPITSDDDCSHEIKRHLLLGRKVMTNLDSRLKSRDITLPTKVHLVKAMVFPVVMYGCEIWTISQKAERQRIDAFELWCWRRLFFFKKI